MSKTAMKHEHNCASNTDEVFRTVIGCRIKGVVKEAKADRSTEILVLECGWGLAFCSTGAFWIVSTADVQKHITKARDALNKTRLELEGVLSLAGVR